jgi:hypothetical protein
LRASGRFNVIVATRPSTSQRNSSVPVSIAWFAIDALLIL